MFTPHTYTLDEGIQIFYTDSGPVPNSNDYTTLIIFHGSAFTGHGFEKLHDVAKDYNLRTVIWNRRDYPGSTPYTDEELEDLKLGHQIFIERLGKLVTQFIYKFINRERIPAMTEDRRKGGIALMGWSMGTATEMSFLLDDKLISSEIYNSLEPYVKDLVLYDPPFRSFGFDVPADSNPYIPWTDPDCKTPEELYQNFLYWVSSYYDHPSLPVSIHDLDFRKRTDNRTVSKWTPEQFAKFYCEPAAVRSELPMYVRLSEVQLHQY
ncbi:hypothetical protein BDQ17DRAFT_1242627 [Cyathus striatus]|nr:hypothetical protein BDQ17DRAFT_1242627 [Cyathus striatus]